MNLVNMKTKVCVCVCSVVLTFCFQIHFFFLGPNVVVIFCEELSQSLEEHLTMRR